MKFFKIFLFPFILSLISIKGISQELHEGHEHHNHEIHNEIAAGAGIAYSSENSNFDPAFHIHAIKGITPALGVGLGYEVILGEDIHQSIGVLLNLKPHPVVDLNFGPGIVLATDHEPLTFMINAEIALIKHLGERFHFGPVLDLGWSLHGIHIIAGVHTGIDF